MLHIPKIVSRQYVIALLRVPKRIPFQPINCSISREATVRDPIVSRGDDNIAQRHDHPIGYGEFQTLKSRIHFNMTTTRRYQCVGPV